MNNDSNGMYGFKTVNFIMFHRFKCKWVYRMLDYLCATEFNRKNVRVTIAIIRQLLSSFYRNNDHISDPEKGATKMSIRFSRRIGIQSYNRNGKLHTHTHTHTQTSIIFTNGIDVDDNSKIDMTITQKKKMNEQKLHNISC